MDEIHPASPDVLREVQPRAVSGQGDESRLELMATQYSGPLPPPELLAKFEEIQTGLAERIVKMAEKQAAHRQLMESKRIDGMIADQKSARLEARIGQIFGFLIGIVAICAGTYASVNGSQWPGAIIGGGGVVALVSVFVIGRRITESGGQHARDAAVTKRASDDRTSDTQSRKGRHNRLSNGDRSHRVSLFDVTWSRSLTCVVRAS